MKTMKISIFRTSAALLLSVIFVSACAGAKDIQRTFSWKFNVNRDANVAMVNYDCNLTIHTWDKAETEFRMTVDAETKSEEDTKTLENYLQGLTFSNSPSSVTFNNTFWESRNTIMNKTTMKLKNGKTVNLVSMKISSELWIPSTCRFDLNSKYSQITMDDLSGPLTLDLYNDNLIGGNLFSDAEISDKYSTMEFSNTKNIRANIYSSKLNAGNSGNINIVSKYSRVNIKSCKTLTVNAYNDKYNIPQTEDVTFTAKYSDLVTENSGNLKADMYEGTITMENAGNVEIESKYALYMLSNAGKCSVSSSYNDKLTSRKLTSLKVVQSKYSNFRIDIIDESVKDLDSYNDTFTISETGNAFTGLTLTGKYTKTTLTLPAALSYHFKSVVKYPDFNINESAMKHISKIVDGSDVKWDAIKGNGSEGIPVIEVNGYSMSLTINEK